MAAIKNAFMLPKPNQATEHLWIVITEPCPVSGEVIMVNVTTRRFDTEDLTTIVEPGEHEFITRESVVYYFDAQLTKASILDEIVKTPICRPKEPITEDLLAKIQKGLLESNFTPGKIIAAYKRAVSEGRHRPSSA